MAPDLPAMHNETHARRHAHVEPVLLKTHAHACSRRTKDTHNRGGEKLELGSANDQTPRRSREDYEFVRSGRGARPFMFWVRSGPLDVASDRLIASPDFLLLQFPHHLPPYNIFLSYIKFFTPLLFAVIIWYLTLRIMLFRVERKFWRPIYI